MRIQILTWLSSIFPIVTYYLGQNLSIIDFRKQCGRRSNITPWDYDQNVIIDPQKPQDFE
jgi:hypothetical protein